MNPYAVSINYFAFLEAFVKMPMIIGLFLPIILSVDVVSVLYLILCRGIFTIFGNAFLLFLVPFFLALYGIFLVFYFLDVCLRRIFLRYCNLITLILNDIR